MQMKNCTISLSNICSKQNRTSTRKKVSSGLQLIFKIILVNTATFIRINIVILSSSPSLSSLHLSLCLISAFALSQFPPHLSFRLISASASSPPPFPIASPHHSHLIIIACIQLIEKNSGILAMMEEEGIIPKGSDDSLLAKLKRRHGKSNVFGIHRLVFYLCSVPVPAWSPSPSSSPCLFSSISHFRLSFRHNHFHHQLS